MGVKFSIDKLNDGEWIHMFPEGKVNRSGTLLPFRWGVGKLVTDSNIPPIVLPIYQLGLDTVVNGPPYVPKMFGKTIDVLVGDPIDFTEVLNKHQRDQTPKPEIYKDITARIETEMRTLEQRMKAIRKGRIKV